MWSKGDVMECLKIEPLHVVQYYINKCDVVSGDSITHLKLQKLLYYTQAWGLVILNKRIFNERFQAWAHGPVLSTLYSKLKNHSYNNMAGEILVEEINLKKIESHLDNVWDSYGELSAKHLEYLTHTELPWLHARGGISPEAKCTNTLDENIMRDFYAKKYEETKNPKARPAKSKQS
jgi:uncharacterized phage-associated protein